MSISGKLRQRCRRFTVLVLALVALGGLYTALAPSSAAEDNAADAAKSSTAVAEGKQLFEQGCISCHGFGLQGIADRGPSLVGVGASSVEFQVSTGRMPAARQEAQAQRKPPKYSDAQVAALAAYVQSLGGGPQIPPGSLRGGKDDIVLGGELFRLNCASCHGLTAIGGALSSGKFAPSLKDATDRQIFAAMQTGPQSMPSFADNQISPQEKKAIIAYVQSMKADKDPGGFGIGRTGPIPEGLVVFLVGIGALLVAALWIAGKS